jgi:hypothetical protein
MSTKPNKPNKPSKPSKPSKPNEGIIQGAPAQNITPGMRIQLGTPANDHSVVVDRLKGDAAGYVVKIIGGLIVALIAAVIGYFAFQYIGRRISGALSGLNPFNSLMGSKPLKPKGPLTSCPANKEKSGALCYDKCPAGYKGVGPVCWQTCPSGFRDDGAFCAKPKAYGRGSGHITKSKCENKNKSTGCEKNGLLWYPKCKAGFDNVGCCICSPKCPSNMGTDIGVSCTKKTRTRGAGSPLECRPGLIKVGALCYEPCPAGYRRKDLLCLKNADGADPAKK